MTTQSIGEKLEREGEGGGGGGGCLSVLIFVGMIVGGGIYV